MKLTTATSSDPVQQKLRDDKKVMNKETSSFINDLIHLKKTLNGTPSKTHPERIPIGQAFSPDVIQELEQLSSDFAAIAGGWKQITEEQAEYAAHRRKKVPHQEAPPAVLAPVQASELLESLGSNKVTRFFSKLQGPMLFDSPAQKRNKYRISLINGIEELFYLVRNIQFTIVESTPESLTEVKDMFDELNVKFHKLEKGFSLFFEEEIKKDPELPPATIPSLLSPGSPTPAPTGQLDFSLPRESSGKELMTREKKIEKVKEWYQDLLAYDAKTNYPKKMDLFESGMKDVLAGAENPKPFAMCKHSYTFILNAAKEHFNCPSAKSLKEVKEQAPPLQANASNIMSRWMNKMKHKLNMSDPTSSGRLKIYEHCTLMRQSFNSILNSLESSVDPMYLKQGFDVIQEQMSTFANLLEPLVELSPEARKRFNRLRMLHQVRNMTRDIT